MGRAVEGGAVLFSIVTLLGALVVYWVLMTNFLFNTGQIIHGQWRNTSARLHTVSGEIQVLGYTRSVEKYKVQVIYGQ